jgi:Zn-dependent M28 family amino/carboxypeptidase
MRSTQKGQPKDRAVKVLPEGRRAWLLILSRITLILAGLCAFVAFTTSMPGKSYAGAFAPLSPDEEQLSANLKNHVEMLAGAIGERNLIHYKSLQEGALYLEKSLTANGYQVSSQNYVAEGRAVRNLVTEIPGASRPSEIVVVGAHYDTVFECPGADDNTSGTAALLELARLLKPTHPARTVRFVTFVNEEPPYFQTANMGSWVYAKKAHAAHDNIVAALSLETVGMYSDVPESQHYPSGFGLLYPSPGNFIAFVANVASRGLVRETIRSFRRTTGFPSQGSAVPGWIAGVGWSDHWSFWQEGYPAVMVTDTAVFRNPNYHQPSDTPDTLDYDRMARVVRGLATVVTDLGK